MLLIRVILSFCFLLCYHGLEGQASSAKWHYIQVDSTKQMWGDWAEPSWLRYFGLDAGDIDSDGDLDILSGRYVYHNPGGAMTAPWKRTVLDDNVDGILLMDVDGDLMADIIAMSLPDLYWYEATNAAGTKYRRKLIGQVPATSHVNSQGFERAQLIAGGMAEFVIAGNGNLYGVEIPTKDPEQETWNINMICANTSDEGIGIGDIDGDGDLDIAAGRRPDGEGEPKVLVWYENPGNIDTLWQSTVIGESVHPIDRIAVSDVDGDKRSDVIVTEERYPGLEPDANVWWYGQKDNNAWYRHHIVEQYSTNNLDIVDYDTDGDIDILMAEHKGDQLELQLWYNDGEGKFSKEVLDTGKENHLGTQFFDLDRDGDLDIIGAGWDQHQYMHVWRNNLISSLGRGMMFRTYPWIPSMVSDEGKFLRVGGKYSYDIDPDHFPVEYHKDGYIDMPQSVDLENAIRAEVIIERVQSHEDSKYLKIQFNEGAPLLIPEPSTIPMPATDYMFHTNITVPVKLTDLKHGVGNRFKFSIDRDQSWGWPQNLIYGVVLKVYYENAGQKNIGIIKGIEDGATISTEVQLQLKTDQSGAIERVDYIAHYEDVNYQGDGEYSQWQYDYHRGMTSGHIGSAATPPYKVTWDTEWISDQSQGMSVAAIVTMVDGMSHVLPAIQDIVLERDYSVALAKPYGEVPFWTTRSNEHEQSWNINIETDSIEAARLYWKSWSPCYAVGMKVNDTYMQSESGLPCYDAYYHDMPVEDVSVLQNGRNTITTLKTPLHDGNMVHGMDVQWPGIQLKIKYKKEQVDGVNITQGSYQDRDHFVIHTESATYYYDVTGGGFSRIIDGLGNDWIGFKQDPWGVYPASAASAYRGLPNFVHGSADSGAGHPGHDKCISAQVGGNKIRTTSRSGLWKWVWTFYKDHAEVEMIETEAATPYWFLYEGIPGGSYNPVESYYGTDQTGRMEEAPDFYKNEIRYDHFNWAYFGKKGNHTFLWAAQLDQDNAIDMMSYLGDSEMGIESKDGMAVFGFGRGAGNVPLLYGPHRFAIGMHQGAMLNDKGHTEVANIINTIIEKKVK